MKRTLIFTSLLFICLFISITGILGDERSEPKDIIIALDKSLSMEEEIDEVKQFINEDIVDRLIKGDYFLLLAFYRTSEVAVAKQVDDPATDIPELKKSVSQILANGPFTDIGNVLDRLRDEFYERAGNNRKKWCFLVTDGINEPSRGSKYYSPDGSFKHEYLSELQEIISRNGWKVQFLEIGEGSDAKEVAETLGVDYAKTEADVTAEEIKESIADPIGSASVVQDTIQPLSIDQAGEGQLQFSVKTERYQQAPQLTIDKLKLISASLIEDNILRADDYPLSLPQSGTTEVSIPVKVKSNIAPGDYPSELQIGFSSIEVLDQDSLTLTVHKNSIFENHRWLLPVLIIAAIFLIGILILLIATLAKGKPVEFKVMVEEAPLPEGKNSFKLTKNKELYLSESLDVVSLTSKKTRKSLGKLTYLADGVKLHILNEFRYEDPDSIPENVLGETIQIRTISSKLYHITFLRTS